MDNKQNKKPVVLIVLDGWGYREEKEHNAIAEAKTPNFDRLWNEYPHTKLEASGLAVGLPEGQMGNSEIGHLTIGAGKTLDTDLVRIKKAGEQGEFSHNPIFLELFDHVIKNDSVLHVQGLIGPGGIHSHSAHLHHFLAAAKNAGVKEVAIHAFTDGRDTPPQSAAQYLRELEGVISDLGIGFIASASGRFYAMDRDKNWERVEKAERAIFHGEGNVKQGVKASDVLEELYSHDIVDEHVEPIVLLDDSGKGYKVNDNDGVFFFNYRPDRAKQISENIAKKAKEMNLCFVTMTSYGDEIDARVAFPKDKIETTLAGEISKAGLTQAHIAETEKFAHATYFLNGGEQVAYEGEKDVLVDSRKDVLTHDLAPEMKASEVADKTVEEIKARTDFIFVNIANADMVGHTAKKEAIIKGLEVADEALGKIINAVEEAGGVAIVTADHGNAEINVDENGLPHTAHTLSPVPFIITDKSSALGQAGTLADIAPTALSLLGLPKPDVITGQNLAG